MLAVTEIRDAQTNQRTFFEIERLVEIEGLELFDSFFGGALQLNDAHIKCGVLANDRDARSESRRG